MFDCPVCMVTYQDKDSFTFPECLHTFCKGCLKGTFETKIKEQDVNTSIFKCIQCLKPFDSSLIEKFVSPQIFKRYCDLALETNQIFGLEDYEKLTDCLNEACREKFVIWKDAEYQDCPKCKVKYCRKCFLPFHEKITCEEQKLNFQDKLYKDVKAKLNTSRCPNCRIMIEKTAGCNFMTCKCGTFYCHLCDIQLTKADHNSHFEGNSPHNMKCKIKGPDGKWISRPVVPVAAPKAVPKLLQQIIKNNDIPCPNCKSVNPNLSELILYERLVKCKTVQCQGQLFCVACAKMVPIQQIPSHFTNQLQCMYKK